jgi:hypothetical protein
VHNRHDETKQQTSQKATKPKKDKSPNNCIGHAFLPLKSRVKTVSKTETTSSTDQESEQLFNVSQ